MQRPTRDDFVRNLGYGFGAVGAIFAVVLHETPALLAPVPIGLALLLGLITSCALLCYELSDPKRLEAARAGPRTPTTEEVRRFQVARMESAGRKHIVMLVTIGFVMVGLVIYSLIGF